MRIGLETPVKICAGCLALRIIDDTHSNDITECCSHLTAFWQVASCLHLWVVCHFRTVQHCIVCVYSAIQCQHSLDLQVLAQPWFAFVENAVYRRFGETHFTHTELVVSIRGTPWLRLTMFRLMWRTAYVCLTTSKCCWFMHD